MKRLLELDALRGLAALMVLAYHPRLLFGLHLPGFEHYLWSGPLHILVAGPEAVILFFVLSGFVLALPIVQRKQLPYHAYLIRRICRIYLPYLGALALALGFDWQFNQTPILVPNAAWLAQTWHAPIQSSLVLAHILFIGQYDVARFNTVFWSLVVEMRVSIIFPLLCWLLLKWRVRTAISIMMALSATGLALVRFSTGALTIHYCAIFGVGILLSAHLERASAWYNSFSRSMRVAALLLGLVLFTYGPLFNKILTRDKAQDAADWFIAAGCFFIILSALNLKSFSSFLRSSVPQYLGRISYSMYLVHSTILFAFVYAFAGRVPLIVLVAGYLPVAVFCSTVFWRWVERPTIFLSRDLGEKATRFSIREDRTLEERSSR
jgi:peptidoglycan/LPS O-acetylase OafA/YrhL